MDERLKTIEFIRDLQVKKKRRKLAVAEREVASISNQLENIKIEVKERVAEYGKRKEEMLSSLKGKRASVDALYLLKKKDFENFNFIEKKHSQKLNLDGSLAEKINQKKQQAKEVWDSEKMLIKIQEFINLEVD
jgi:hypothetical protein